MYEKALLTILAIAEETPRNNLRNVVDCFAEVLKEQEKQKALAEQISASFVINMDGIDGETHVQA